MTAVSTRPRLRSHIHIWLRVIRKADRTIWKVTQIWRMDYEAIQPFGAQG